MSAKSIRRTTLTLAAVGALTVAPVAASAAPTQEAAGQDDVRAEVAQRLGVPASQLDAGTRSTASGLTHITFQQQVDGRDVLGAQAVVTLDGQGQISDVLGRLEKSGTSVAKSARVRADARTGVRDHASRLAKVAGSKVTTSQGTPVLVDLGIIRKGTPTGKLVPATRVSARAAGGTFYGPVVVDNATGKVLVDGFAQRSLNRVICDKGNANVNDAECSGSAVERKEGGASSDIADVNHAYEQFGTGSAWVKKTLGFDLTNKIGLDTDDGNGKALRSWTRGCDPSADTQCPMRNAFWDGRQMVFGQGLANADDVIVHELSHGVSERNGMTYSLYGEDGAINEHISDVFGELYDQANPTGKDGASYNWQVGEDLTDIFGTYIRNMKDPSGFDGSPDKYSDLNGAEAHDGAGIGNKTAYLIAAGGSFNGQSVTGLGNTKTAKLFYAVDDALPANATYKNEGSLLKSQCAALKSAGTVTAADCTNVGKAVKATEIG